MGTPVKNLRMKTGKVENLMVNLSAGAIVRGHFVRGFMIGTSLSAFRPCAPIIRHETLQLDASKEMLTAYRISKPINGLLWSTPLRQ